MIQTGKCGCCHVEDPDPQEKAKLLRVATRWLAEMEGPGWEIRLHHNIRWHWSLQNLGGKLNVYPDSDDSPVKWHSLFSLAGGGGDCRWTDNYWSVDPNRVVRHQLKLVQTRLAEERADFEKAEELLSSLIK